MRARRRWAQDELRWSNEMARAKSSRRRKVGKVMGEYKRGKLKSGGRQRVRSRKQAIAIAMSESGQSRRKQRRK
jgi:hypothetical protein